jgi:hypothetical protein
MATTPNFNWATPDNTGLVKNGALDIRTLGDSIDASLVDLKGGTTNQVLAKNSNTDMDFKWVADASGMTNPMTTTGDVIYSSSGSTPARLGIGTANQVLRVNSGATAPEWATPAAATSGLTLISATAIGSAVASVTVSSAFSSTYDEYLILWELGTVAATANISLQLGSNTSYRGNIIYMADTATTVTGANYNTSTTMFVGYAATDGGSGSLLVSNPNKAKKTVVQGANTSFVTTQQNNVLALCYYDTQTTQHTAFTIACTQNMTGGNIRLYGYQKS